jgi:hypothetical protein
VGSGAVDEVEAMLDAAEALWDSMRCTL